MEIIQFSVEVCLFHAFIVCLVMHFIPLMQYAVDGISKGHLWLSKKIYFIGFKREYICFIKKRYLVGGKIKGSRLAIGVAGDVVVVNRDLLRQLAGAVADGVDDLPGQGTVEVFILQGFLSGQGVLTRSLFLGFFFCSLGLFGGFLVLLFLPDLAADLLQA